MCLPPPPQWPPVIPARRLEEWEKQVMAQEMLRQSQWQRARRRTYTALPPVSEWPTVKAATTLSLWSRLKSRASRVTWNSWG